MTCRTNNWSCQPVACGFLHLFHRPRCTINLLCIKNQHYMLLRATYLKGLPLLCIELQQVTGMYVLRYTESKVNTLKLASAVEHIYSLHNKHNFNIWDTPLHVYCRITQNKEPHAYMACTPKHPEHPTHVKYYATPTHTP